MNSTPVKLTPNWSLNSDTQHHEAAPRQVLRAGYLQRYPAP
jgi:hypothetical protein